MRRDLVVGIVYELKDEREWDNESNFLGKECKGNHDFEIKVFDCVLQGVDFFRS